MPASVESFCNTLARSRLLPPDQIRALRQQWLREAKEGASDLDQFQRWLVAGAHLTPFQLGALNRGHADQLFLGRYKLLEPIGRGPLAGAYRAAHQLGQTVAVRVLPPSTAKDPPLLARFLREAHQALRLKHPNVVRTFQVAEDRGLHYLVLEYLEGESLEAVLQRRGRLSPAEAVRIVHQALLGLQHVHEQGLTHQNLKPANLLLVGATPESTLSAAVKILAAGPRFERTTDAELRGAPDYQAPEQPRDRRAADIRGDIYSLGAVLYHALAGQPPHGEDSRPVRALNPEVPDGLQQILGWMLARDPGQRYPTPERAAQALQVFLTAGAEPPAPEQPRMQAYLSWLESESIAEAATPAVPVARPTAPVPDWVKPEEPASGARPPTASARPAKEERVYELREEDVLDPPFVDVELVSAEAPEDRSGGSLLPLLLIGVGAGVLLLALAGATIAWLVLAG